MNRQWNRALALAMSLLLIGSAGTALGEEKETAETAATAVETTVAAEDTTAAAVETAADEEVIPIGTAEELAAIADNLSGNYVLTADIDLGGTEWTPIGSFSPRGESEEESELPSEEFAFTGTFDGADYTISNLQISQPEGYALGLFGCIAGAQVGNFSVKNASVEGTAMVGDVIGYSYQSTVYDIVLEGGKVLANATEMSSEGMYGGIIGAAMDGRVINCKAQADITIPDNTANAGIIGGGFEGTSVYNCTTEGTVTAGSNCFGLGGVTGCGFGSQDFMGNEAYNVTITTGDDCFWIGGITGYAGGFEDESFDVPVTELIDCSTGNVSIVTGSGASGVGDIIGAGFYNEEVAATYGAPYDQPTVYYVLNCTAE